MKNEITIFTRKPTTKIKLKKTKSITSLNSNKNNLKRLPRRNGKFDFFQESPNCEISKFLQNVQKKHTQKQKEEFSKKRLEVLFKFIFYIFSNIMNIISVFNYMLQTFFDEDDINNASISLGLSYVELALTFYFLLEYILLAFRLKGGYFKHLISIDSFIDMITIVPSIIAYFISFRGIKLNFIRIFRIFRVFRVLRIYKSLRRIQNEAAEDNSDNGSREKTIKLDPIKLQFFTIVVILVCVFFIGAGLVLGVNDLIDNAFSMKKFNFLDAIYFMIVTFSTLGYGDITPSNPVSRFMIIIGLFCLIIIVSDQMTKLANLLKFWGPGISAFYGENHIILIIDKSINIEMILTFLANRIQTKIDFIVISKDIKPFSYTFYPYNKTIVINAPNIDLELLDLINVKSASGVFIFSSKYLNNYEQYDKITDYFLMKLTQNFLKNNIYIQSLNTEKTLLNVVNDDNKKYSSSFQHLKRVIPIWKIKSQMIAKSSFNPGFATFIQNLLFNYQPIPSDIFEYSEIIQHYIFGTRNKIIVSKLSQFFVKQDFYDVMYMIYFKSISDYFYKINTEPNTINVFILIGVFEENLLDKYQQDNLQIFPSKYEIKNTTKGIFIGPFDKENKLHEIMNEFNSYGEIEVISDDDISGDESDFKIDSENSGLFTLNKIKSKITENNYESINTIKSRKRSIENSKKISEKINSPKARNNNNNSLSNNMNFSKNRNVKKKNPSNDSILEKSDNNNIKQNLKKKATKEQKNTNNDFFNFLKIENNNIKSPSKINENNNIRIDNEEYKYFESNCLINNNKDSGSKKLLKSSTNILNSNQIDNFKQNINGNQIFKKYKSSAIDINKNCIKNKYNNNNEKINLEMKINICNQDKYSNNGNVNINLNLNTFINNNNYARMTRENNTKFKELYLENKIPIIDNNTNESIQSNTLNLNKSSLYKKKSESIKDINDEKIVYSSDSLEVSKEKVNQIRKLNKQNNSNLKYKQKMESFINDNLSNQSNNRNNSKSYNLSKGFYFEELKENTILKKIKQEAKSRELIHDPLDNLLTLKENQLNINKLHYNNINDNKTDGKSWINKLKFNIESSLKNSNSKRQIMEGKFDGNLNIFKQKSSNNLNKQIDYFVDSPSPKKKIKKNYSLRKKWSENFIHNSPIINKKRLSYKNIDFQNCREIFECTNLNTKKYKNKNTALNLEILNKVDKETVYEFSNESLDHLARKNYKQNSEDEREMAGAINGEHVIEHKIHNIEKTNYSSYFKDHIVIVGYQDNLYKLLKLLFSHHEKEICLITRYDYEDTKIIKLLKQYKNLCYIKGHADNPVNLINCGLNNAFMVIFLTEKLSSKTNEDMDNLLIYKTVDFFFDTKLLIEIWDNKNTKFLGFTPLIKNGKTEKNEFLHPCFMSGRIIYTSHLDLIVANSYFNEIGTNAWMKLLNLGLQNMTNRKGNDENFQNEKINNKNNKNKKNKKIRIEETNIKNNNLENCKINNNNQNKYIYQKGENNNNGSPVIFTIEIPIQYVEKEYYILVDDLMKLEPPAMPLGIYVSQPLDYVSIKSQGKIQSNSNPKNGDRIDIFTSHKKKLVNRDEMDKNDKGYQGKLKIMRDISYNNKIVLDIMDLNKNFLPIFITNPGPNFIISNNCKVMILYYLKGDSLDDNGALLNKIKGSNPNQKINFKFAENLVKKGIETAFNNKKKKESTSDVNRIKKDFLKAKQEKILMFYEILKKKIMNTINDKYVHFDDSINGNPNLNLNNKSNI